MTRGYFSNVVTGVFCYGSDWNSWIARLFPCASAIVVVTTCLAINCLAQTGDPASEKRPTPLPQAHAHNDYHHQRPFWDAYEHGFCSIEVDIYKYQGELLVAHSPLELFQKRRLVDLYLEPMLKVTRKNDGRIYQDGPETIQLLVDIKQDGEEVFKLLKKTLQPYREMICCVENGQYQKRAVQIVISGDRPKELILNDPDRLMSIDGRLSDLKSELPSDQMPLISDRWGNHFQWNGEGAMPAKERQKLRRFVEKAHKANRRVRFWGTPESSDVWRVLLTAKVDHINTDQLTKLQSFLRNGATSSSEQDDSITRIGVIGCHRQDKPAPALNRYLQASPDVALWVGDNVYADSLNDISHIEKCYQRLESQTAYRNLREAVPFAVTWDDHDYGLNNFGKHYRLKHESRKLFRKFWKLESFIPEDRDGIYHARYFGTGQQVVQIILLDTRFNRDDEGDQSDTLGENQWKWLEHELTRPANLRLVVSGYQVLLDREQQFETWSKFPKAKKRLFDLIKSSKAENLIFVAGDQHYGEVSRQKGALGYDAIEFMFAGINQAEQHVFNSRRVSPVAHALNAYALIDIQWDRTLIDQPHVLFRCFDADTNQAELMYRVNFSELKR